MIDNQKANGSINQNFLLNSLTRKSFEKPVYAISQQENFDIEKIKLLSSNYNFISKKQELENFRILKDANTQDLQNSNPLKKDIFNTNDNDLLLNLLPSKPDKREEINLSNIYQSSLSFEINVDMLNRVTSSGGLENLKFEINKKNLN